MPDSANFSRGNSRASGVDDPDIKGVSRESPLTLRSQLSVTITDCADEAADEAASPCDEINLKIYGVMGQEDRYRHDGQERVQRGGIARIVATTTEKANVDVNYIGNPNDQDNPAFNSVEKDASQDRKYHEIFFPVNPATLYAFKLDVQAAECPDEDLDSGIYYFQTGDVIELQTCNGFEAQVHHFSTLNFRDVGFGSPDFFDCQITQGSVNVNCPFLTPTESLQIISLNSDLIQTLDNSTHITQESQVV